MSAGSQDRTGGAECLSALVDGEVDAVAVLQACDAWRADSEVRSTWHAYQLIGDVLRSDDLASRAAHDAGFLVAVRARLVAEPVVLAPAPLVARKSAEGLAPPESALFGNGALASLGRGHRAGRWMLPTAVAAGFVLVAGTFVVLRPGSLPQVPPAALALADVAAPGNGSNALRPVADASGKGVVDATGAVVPAAVIVNARLIRDTRLDRYLAAHKQFAGSSALGVPSAFLRSATVDAEPR